MKYALLAAVLLAGSFSWASWSMSRTLHTKSKGEVKVWKTDSMVEICVLGAGDTGGCIELTTKEAEELAHALMPSVSAPDPEFKRILDEMHKKIDRSEDNRFIESGRRAVENMRGQRIK